jgi:S1-C subfamily serine protease
MSQVLQSLAGDLAALVAAAGHSIVRVEARRRAPASGIVWSADGMIVTSHHVVERDENIHIGLPDGSKVSASLVGRDPTTDIAVLKADTSGLTPAAWTAADQVSVGQLVLAVGRPDAQTQATLGIISAVEGEWRTHGGGLIDRYIQTDVIMYPGFSGGPLVSADGSFVGINSSALARGVSVTLPAATITRVVNTLVAHGRVKRGYLGVSAQPVRLPSALAQSVGQETGLLLASVEANSPAEAAGMLLGDTLVSLDGHAVRTMDDLMVVLAGDKVGTAVTARIVRGGAVQELSVTIGERS